MNYCIKAGLLIMVMGFGIGVNAWAMVEQPSITVTYDKPASVQTDGSVKVMNAYNLSPRDVAKLNSTDLQAIKSCGVSSSNIQVVSKSVGGQQMLFCDGGANAGMAVNMTTSDLISSSNMQTESICTGAYC